MKNKKMLFIIILIVILLVSICVFINLKFYNKTKEEHSNNDIIEKSIKDIEKKENEKENVLFFNIEKQNKVKEEKQEENRVEEQVMDAATLTNEIYSLNTEIGTLYIPKTGLRTPIFSQVKVDKMEQMPCFLYTTGGLNKIGVTLFVGHNRMNGKLFSENRKLEEGDEFYFKDYEGKELKYIIYSKFITTESDTSYLNNNVDNPTIALSCCTDENNENRIIILGKA